jgi:hypothetical protein
MNKENKTSNKKNEKMEERGPKVPSHISTNPIWIKLTKNEEV